MKDPSASSDLRRIVVSVLTVALVVGAASYLAYVTWPAKIEIIPAVHTPVFGVTDEGRQAVQAGSEAVLAEVAYFPDELLAYLHLQHMRNVTAGDGVQVLLTAREADGGPEYVISLQTPRDLLSSVPYLAELKASRRIRDFEVRYVPASEAAYKQQQTAVFDAAYNIPVRRKLESLTTDEVLAPLVKFLLFKSRTDPRVRRQLDPPPPALSRKEATRLAADITAVARFYSLPLEFFLGIGAMENNYMDVEGDIEHAVWKRRAEKGDIVLKRRKGRVQVMNFSLGRWQITRETLRYTHRLYLKDERNYNLLPERLRPSRELDLNRIEVDVLTTYAGLLFRYLLDRFDGDVNLAVGAYNGGPGNPNEQYADGVELAARYARRILEQAAALNGNHVAETRFVAPPR